MTRLKILLPFLILLLLLTIFSLHIPFFWDSAFFSSLSVHFYNHGFDGFMAPANLDTGGFPLYSTYMAIVWNLFGKSLSASHFAMFPFMIGLFYQFFILCKRYLNEKTIVWALLLFIIEPVFLMQSMIMGYDIIIAFFFLLALNALYNKKDALFSLAVILLCLISIRGIMLTVAVFMLDAIYQERLRLKILLRYVPALLILLIWTIYHQQQTGWYVFSPFREDNAEELSGLEMILRQLIYIAWKALDLGRIMYWLVFMFFSILLFKKTKTNQHKELVQNLLIPFFVLTIFMIVIQNPIGHKYFLSTYLILIIAVCYFIQHIDTQKSRILVYATITICMIAGNFIEYPQRYGNAWDSSLKTVPYFDMEKDMRTYVSTKKIPVEAVGTQFPLTTTVSSSYLGSESSQYTDIENANINEYSYFLYSNIINSGRMEDLEKIKKTWIVEKEMKRGMIELILYKNPSPYSY